MVNDRRADKHIHMHVCVRMHASVDVTPCVYACVYVHASVKKYNQETTRPILLFSMNISIAFIYHTYQVTFYISLSDRNCIMEMGSFMVCHSSAESTRMWQLRLWS